MNITSVLIRRERHTRRGRPSDDRGRDVVMTYKPRDAEECQKTSRSKEGQRRLPYRVSERRDPADSLISAFQLQNFETVNLCCVKPPSVRYPSQP